MMQTRRYVLLWIVLTQVHKLAESTITCEVPSVPRGTPTHVTCHFSEDLVQTKKAFAIHRYGKKEHFEEILNCLWIEHQHICDKLPGYEFDGQITNKVTVKIPSASEENVGRYACQVVPPDTDDLASCNFILNETTAAAVTLTEETTATFKGQEDDEDASLLPILVPVALLLFIAVLVGVAICFRERLREQISYLCASSKREENAEDPHDKQPVNGAQCKTPFLDNGSQNDEREPGWSKPDLHTKTDEKHKAEVTPLLGSTVEEASPEKSVTHDNSGSQFNGKGPTKKENSNLEQTGTNQRSEPLPKDHEAKQTYPPNPNNGKSLTTPETEDKVSAPAAARKREASPLQPCLSSEQLSSEDALQNQPTQTLHALPPHSVSSEAKEKPLTEETDRKPPTDLPPETEDKSSIRAPARKRDIKELFTAISENDVEKVRKVLDKGVNVNSRDTKGERPLHVACRHGSESVLEILLERGANIEATDNRGLTPLHWACIYGKPAIVNLMISRRANVKAVGEDGATALHLACQNGLKVILEILLQAGSEIEAKDRNGLTPLHWACKYGKTAAIETLIDCGADVNAKGNDGTTPFHIACENGQYAVLNILLANGYDVEAKDKQGMTALRWACKQGKEPLAKMILDKGADANARAEDGTTPLHVACQTGKEGVIETLLTAGSDIEATDKTGMTPLHWACKTGQETSVKTLLAHGSKVNAREQDDWTPLHLACQKGSKEIVLLLHKHNADVEAKTLKHELTAKDVARRRLNKDIVELMEQLSKDSRPDTDDKSSMKLKR